MIVAELGVDNVRAVPEPDASLRAGAAAAALAGLRTRRRPS